MRLDGLAETDMSGIVGMQAVIAHSLGLCFGLREIHAMLGLHGEEAGVLIKVDARHCPILASLTQHVHVFLDIVAQHVGEVLVGLDVEPVVGRVAEVGVSAVDGRHDDDLLGRIVVLQPGETHVDASAEGGVVHAPFAMTSCYHPAIAVADGVTFGEEASDGNAMIVVVGTCPDEDGIDGGAVGLLHQFGLLEYLVPLVTAAGIDTRLDAERIAQVIVIMVIGSRVVWIGHRITQKGATLALPLCHARRRQKACNQGHGIKKFSHFKCRHIVVIQCALLYKKCFH